ncbi:hypothetical protein QUF74_01995 [Candidatus Halobeggiatoa sp. HSG11]|nr:hypothetical protein [Candidatus Halobeggiatoa sp. HSG11]
MKRRNFLKTTLTIGGMSALATFPATAFQTQTQKLTVTGTNIGAKDFFLSFWGSPHPTLDSYKEIVECGFNIATGSASDSNGCPDSDFGKQQLKLAEEVGLKFVLRDPRICVDLPDGKSCLYGKPCENLSNNNWQQVVQQVIDDYSSYSSLYGYFLDDDFNNQLAKFDNLAKLVQEFRTRDPKHISYTNLFPNFASETQLGTPDYDEYVKKFVEIVKPPLISFDFYALLQAKNCEEQSYSNSCNRQGYFPNLNTIRKYAVESNTPFCSIILSTPHFDYRDPTPAEIRWQVYTSLAYGSRGIIYFTYATYIRSPEWPTNHNLDNAHNGILDRYGYRTSKFDAVRNINLGLQKLIPYLVKLTSLNVYQVYRDKQLSQFGIPDFPSTGGSIITRITGGEFLLGEFKDSENNGWLMIVNLDYNNSAQAVISLKDIQANRIRYVSRTTGQLTKFPEQLTPDKVLYTWLAPGDGKLLRVV